MVSIKLSVAHLANSVVLLCILIPLDVVLFHSGPFHIFAVVCPLDIALSMPKGSTDPNKPHVFCSCYQLIDIDAMSSVAF